MLRKIGWNSVVDLVAFQGHHSNDTVIIMIFAWYDLQS